MKKPKSTEAKYQVRYMYADDPQTYFTYVFEPIAIAEAKAEYANRHFKRNGAKHFLGPANEYIDPERG